MLKSPGSASRSLIENLEFNNLNIIEKILHNIPNFNFYLFFKNSSMIIITLIPIIYYLIKNKKEKYFIYFLLSLGLLSSMIKLILPTWGDRITLYSIITLILIGIYLIDKIIKNENKIYKYLKITYILTASYLLVCFISINKLTIYRENYIKEQLNNNKDTIEIIRNPIMYVWNNNPESEYFINTYKSYQDINEEKEIKIIQLSYKEYINIVLGR